MRTKLHRRLGGEPLRGSLTFPHFIWVIAYWMSEGRLDRFESYNDPQNISLRSNFMKLFCVSDIHSYYTACIEALKEAGFDKDNPEHWLISCGDAFDRGSESEEVLHFLMSLERKILIMGNHDLLLEDCCMREFPYSHDFSN